MRSTQRHGLPCQSRGWAEDLRQCARVVRMGFRRHQSKPAVVVALGIATVIAITSGACMGRAVERWIRAMSSPSLAAKSLRK